MDSYYDPYSEDPTKEQWDKIVENIGVSAGNLTDWALAAMDAVKEQNYYKAYAIYEAVKTGSENLKNWTYYLLVYDMTGSKPQGVED